MEKDRTEEKRTLNELTTLAIILDNLYKPVEQMMRERNCTADKAIEYKEIADKYVRKKAAKLIRENIRIIREKIQ